MIKRILISLILTLFAAPAQTAPISVGNISNINVANTLLGSSSNADCATNVNSNNCDFLDFEDTLLTDTELASTVTYDPANYVYRSSTGNKASFDLGFDGFNLYNGTGNDLVIFVVGNDSSFGLDVFDESGTKFSSSTFYVTVENTVFDSDDNWLCVGGIDDQCTKGYALSAIFVDFGDSIAGDVALSKIHLSLNNSAISLAGGFHTEAMVVPLPLSAVLFSSGLALLGWVGRRRAA